MKYEITKLIATTTLRFQEAWYVLRIKNVEANDYTKYFCVARNRIGENRQTVIELFGKYEILIFMLCKIGLDMFCNCNITLVLLYTEST